MVRAGRALRTRALPRPPPPPSGGRGIPASLTSNFHLEKRDAVAAPASPIGARPRRGTESPSFSAAVERGEIAVSGLRRATPARSFESLVFVKGNRCG